MADGTQQQRRKNRLNCTHEDCDRPAYCRGLCNGHYRRAQRGYLATGGLRHWGQPGRSVREAALAYADAESEQDYARGEARLRMATRRAAVAARRRANKVPNR